MKKLISLLLVVLSIFSFTTVAFAEEATTAPQTVKVYFEYNNEDGTARVDEFDVAYGTDLDTVAPKAPNFVHPNDSTTKMYFLYWTTNHNAYKDEQLTNLPAIGATDNIKEIKFVAYYDPRENNVQNNVQDAFDQITGNLPTTETFEGLGDFFTTIVNLFKKWFEQVFAYLQSFIFPAF